MKYITLASPHSFHVVIFSKTIQHSDVAVALKLHGDPVSAGFVDLSGAWPRCYGRSESLNIGPNSEDENDIAATLRS